MPFSFGAFELDPERRQLLRDGGPVPLEPKAYELLLLLVERRPRALSRAQIRDAIWPRTFVSESTLAVVVSGIRTALEDDARQPRFIRTVHGFGYSFCGEAHESDGAAQATVEPPREAPVSIEPLREAPVSVPPAEPVRRSWPWLAVSALALAVLIAAWLRLRPDRLTPQGEALHAVPITSLPGTELQPALSPDGRRVAFMWDGPGRNNFDIYVKDVAGADMVRVTSDPAPDHHPVWSPDGRHLAFLRHLPGEAAVILAPVGGGDERRLASVAEPLSVSEAYWLDWSPDGRFIAAPDRQAGNWGVVLISVETGEKRVVTATSDARRIDHFPAFSPDGRRLAFLRGGLYLDYTADLLIQALSADGAPVGPVTTKAQAIDAGPITWLPAGNELIVGNQRVPLDASRPRSLVPLGAGRGLDLSGTKMISVRGTRLAFSTFQAGLHLERVPLRGLTEAPSAPYLLSSRGEESPAISPDGRKVAFTSWRSGDGQLWICSVDGSGCQELPHVGEYASSVSWSPDGHRLAFDATDQKTTLRVYVFTLEGGSVRPLTGGRIDARPRWSRDGRSIYFASARSGDWQIWKMPADGKDDAPAVRITRSGGMEAEESEDGRFLYYAKRKATGIFRLRLAEAAAGATEEEKVLDIGGEGLWGLAPRGRGILVLDPGARPPTIRFHAFDTGRTTDVVALPVDSEFVEMGGAFTVSPDGEWAIVTVKRIEQSDIMLVDGFR